MPQHPRPESGPSHESPRGDSVEKPVSRIVRIGAPQFSHDVLKDGQRLFLWQIRPADAELAAIAGWDRLHEGTIEGTGIGVLRIPASTRPVGNVLSGVAAWPTEKDELLSSMGLYVQTVRGAFKGKVDTGLALNTVGVTRVDTVGATRVDRMMFMVPPHNLSEDPEEIEVWRDCLLDDISAVLADDPRKQELVDGFRASLSFKGEDH
jgi:hypothetical protein